MSGEEFAARLTEIEETRQVTAETLAQARRLTECGMPDELFLKFNVGPVPADICARWHGHEAELEVCLSPGGWELTFWPQDDAAPQSQSRASSPDLTRALGYLRDSHTAASLELSVAEWRAMTQDRGAEG